MVINGVLTCAGGLGTVNMVDITVFSLACRYKDCHCSYVSQNESGVPFQKVLVILKQPVDMGSFMAKINLKAGPRNLKWNTSCVFSMPVVLAYYRPTVTQRCSLMKTL